jgi:hypothetical protein
MIGHRPKGPKRDDYGKPPDSGSGVKPPAGTRMVWMFMESGTYLQCPACGQTWKLRPHCALRPAPDCYCDIDPDP